jgi:hypothetical protein
MPDITTKPAVPTLTHTAYFFIRTGTTKRGKVYGYWKDGGRFRAEGGADAFFAFVDMVPRSGWDGRIKFVPIGDPAPDTDAKAPERPDATGDDEDDDFKE